MDDPFATAEDAKAPPRDAIITGGRYRLPNLDGSHKKGGWQRTTNLVSAYSDQYGLRMWEIEQALRGVVLDPKTYADLADAVTTWDLMPKDVRRHDVEAFLERLKAITGANRGAIHGNHKHTVVEEYHADTPIGEHWKPADHRDVALYAAAFVRHGLRALPGMQERYVLIEPLEACGKLDNVVEDLTTGELHIADLKTQKKFWTFMEVKAQLACYANADAMWDGTKWVDMPKVSREAALALWMPRETEDGQPRVDVIDLDIVEGWHTAQLARRIVVDRKVGRSGGRLRVTMTERYAAMFAGVGSHKEGRALVAEARRVGAWGPVLADCATAALDRLTKDLVS